MAQRGMPKQWGLCITCAQVLSRMWCAHVVLSVKKGLCEVTSEKKLTYVKAKARKHKYEEVTKDGDTSKEAQVHV